jgi:acyl carrier protein phosphodiesterase
LRVSIVGAHQKEIPVDNLATTRAARQLHRRINDEAADIVDGVVSFHRVANDVFYFFPDETLGEFLRESPEQVEVAAEKCRVDAEVGETPVN